MKVIEVMRNVQTERAQILRSTRLREKLNKKMKNVNFLTEYAMKGEISKGKNLKSKIKKMRKSAIFPLPKSFTNYKKRKGLLGKNSIQINKTATY